MGDLASEVVRRIVDYLRKRDAERAGWDDGGAFSAAADEIERLGSLWGDLAASRTQNLTDTPAVVFVGPWRSIDTAPRDGSPILLGYFLEGGGGGDPIVARWHSGLCRWCAGGKHLLMAEGYFSPTHWMPLPKPPNASGNVWVTDTPDARRANIDSVLTGTVTVSTIGPLAIELRRLVMQHVPDLHHGEEHPAEWEALARAVLAQVAAVKGGLPTCTCEHGTVEDFDPEVHGFDPYCEIHGVLTDTPAAQYDTADDNARQSNDEWARAWIERFIESVQQTVGLHNLRGVDPDARVAARAAVEDDGQRSREAAESTGIEGGSPPQHDTQRDPCAQCDAEVHCD